MKFLKNFARRSKAKDSIIIVSGLPRCGTSMMMKMLESGGVHIFTDNIRKPDEDNPRGYYEVERVKNLASETDKSWLADARGKALKAISYLLNQLPPQHHYQVIFMERNLQEVLASQNKMLRRNGKTVDESDDEKMIRLYRKHLLEIKDWLSRQNNFSVLFIDYAKVVQDPRSSAARVQHFLGRELDPQLMAQAVDAGLYRNRVATKG